MTALPGDAGEGRSHRSRAATPLRALLNRVFPDHWSFLLGEIALYSFIVLLLSGVFLSLFFEPSMKEVVYDGSYAPLRGTNVSAAFASTMDISFDVRGGLVIRQMHHWAALLFMASIVGLILRIFFTGAFRKPRRASWIVALLLFWTGCLAGLTGYTLPDDALSGTSLRIASGVMLSIPVVGSWLTTSIFNGEFPGEVIIGRLSIRAYSGGPSHSGGAVRGSGRSDPQAEADAMAAARAAPTPTWWGNGCSRDTRSIGPASSASCSV